MWVHITLLFVIMVMAGVVGGYVNYHLEFRDNKENASALRSIAVGVAASFLVPLFLKLMASNLVTSSAKSSEEYYIFAGFCLIASISSTRFIKSLSERILEEAKDAKQKADKAKFDLQPILDRATEPNPDEIKNGAAATKSNVPESFVKILKAFLESKYIWRTLGGLSEQLPEDKSQVEKELKKLEELSYLNSKSDSKLGKLWSLSSNGRLVAMQILNSKTT